MPQGKYISVSIEEIEKEKWKEKVTDCVYEKDLYEKSDF